jgi:hypothetical protein
MLSRQWAARMRPIPARTIPHGAQQRDHGAGGAWAQVADILADREDAVPPGLDNVEGCPRLDDVREGRSPLRPVLIADGGDAVPPDLSEFGRAPGH